MAGSAEGLNLPCMSLLLLMMGKQQICYPFDEISLSASDMIPFYYGIEEGSSN